NQPISCETVVEITSKAIPASSPILMQFMPAFRIIRLRQEVGALPVGIGPKLRGSLLYGTSVPARSLECAHRLAEVIGQMVGAAQQDGEAIARSIFREIFFRYGRVPLEPVGPRHFLKPLPRFTVYGFPCLANLFVRRNGGLGLVGIRDEGDIELGMKPISERQQRQHRVMHRREMSPQVKQPVSARRYFPQDLFGRESSKKLVPPVQLCLPYLQPESHIRAFVCHSFISSTLRQVRRAEPQVIGS